MCKLWSSLMLTLTRRFVVHKTMTVPKNRIWDWRGEAVSGAH